MSYGQDRKVDLYTMRNPFSLTKYFASISATPLVVLGLLVATLCVFGQGNPKQAPTHDVNKLETLTIPIQIEGFLKPSITIPLGFYYVVVDNHSGRRDLHFSLERTPGNGNAKGSAEVVVAGQSAQNTARFAQALHLTPGTYRLSVVERPSWIFTITVQ